jgi:hypothetical protein
MNFRDGLLTSEDSDSGQYMVEFALTFVVFVVFIVFVVDMAFMIYNHNLFYNAVYRGARTAALGASNQEIRNEVSEYAAENYFPTIFMVAHPESGVTISPSDEIDRVQGTTVRVSMRTTFGINFMGMIPVTITYPISSEELFYNFVDNDRDGLKDPLEANPKDHDNDGQNDNYFFSGPDMDADNDGTNAGKDTVKVGYFDGVAVDCPGGLPFGVDCVTGGTYSGFAIERPHDAPTASECDVFAWPSGSGREWQTPPCFDGQYHAPEVWHNQQDASPKLFPRKLPTLHVDNTDDVKEIRTLRTEHDSDNDGWIDKYDEAPNDVTAH